MTDPSLMSSLYAALNLAAETCGRLYDAPIAQPADAPIGRVFLYASGVIEFATDLAPPPPFDFNVAFVAGFCPPSGQYQIFGTGSGEDEGICNLVGYLAISKGEGVAHFSEKVQPTWRLLTAVPLSLEMALAG